MSECPICFNDSDLINLNCNHFFCRTCLSRWTGSCPMCRQNINISINLQNLTLNDSCPKNIGLSILSPKGESNPIIEAEVHILENIFGSFKKVNLNEVRVFDKLMVQEYKGNSWFVGIVNEISNYDISLINTIFIKRNNGKIFFTKPNKRDITISNKDLLFQLL